MSAAVQLAGKELIPRRNLRFPLGIPVDVTVLRSGVPDSIPGRSLDVGEGGLALILAGELHLGDPVGIEFRLPNLSSAVQAKAVVRHQAQLRCGLEFLGLSDEQQAMIRYWAAATSVPKITEHKTEARSAPKSSAGQKLQAVDNQRSSRRPHLSATVISATALSLVLAAALGWWHWRRAWQELESPTAIKESSAARQLDRASADGPIRLPAEMVDRLVIHKVDPILPANAHGLGDVVVLDAVIAANGTVADVRPLSGPQVLTAAAIDAVKWWRFQPFRVNGKPVRVETTVAIDFHSTEN
jgi:Gram-negative bacterial TonB protein C-terminal/PilZ domain